MAGNAFPAGKPDTHLWFHAADPFDKRVAMSMAIVAAALAFVAMLSHRAHNKVLQYQNVAAAHNIAVETTVENAPDSAAHSRYDLAVIGGELEAAEPLPRWQEMGPWIGWPALAIVLFGIHQVLERRRSGKAGPTSAAHRAACRARSARAAQRASKTRRS